MGKRRAKPIVWNHLTRCSAYDQLDHSVPPDSNTRIVPDIDCSNVFDDLHFERISRYLYLTITICLNAPALVWIYDEMGI